MYQPRRIESTPDWDHPTGVKVYTVTAREEPLDRSVFEGRLETMLASKAIDWETTPAFAIFHRGTPDDYLVLCWWGNENELRICVEVRRDDGWIADAERYSICIWDLEIVWNERNFFIDSVYQRPEKIDDYRQLRFVPHAAVDAS